MEQDDIKKIIAERLEIIPKEVKDAILSVDYSDKLQEVVKRNRLMIDQAGKLEMETTLVLLGLEPLSDYTKNIADKLEMPMSKAITIANDVNQLIFRDIREALQKMNDAEDAQETESATDLSLRAVPNSGLGSPSNITTPSRASLISEIENPTPSKPVSLSIPTSNLPDIDKDNSPMVVNAKLPANTDMSIDSVGDIIESKLKNEISLPKQEVKIEEKTKIPVKNDPYREPII